MVHTYEALKVQNIMAGRKLTKRLEHKACDVDNGYVIRTVPAATTRSQPDLNTGRGSLWCVLVV